MLARNCNAGAICARLLLGVLGLVDEPQARRWHSWPHHYQLLVLGLVHAFE